MGRTVAALAAIALTAACVPSCGGANTQTARTETKTVIASPTAAITVPPADLAPSPPQPPPSPAAAQAPGGVRSELLDLTLPAGTVPACCGKYEGLEVWNTPAAYAFTVQSLREQLPIKRDYNGLPWCSQEINGKLGYTQWDWGDDKRFIVVVVNQDGQISLTDKPDDEGREGCDTP